MGAALIGEYNHNVDAKGRLSVPFKFRETLGSEVVIARGFDKCLTIYTVDDFSKYVDLLYEKLDTSDTRERMFLKKFTAQADKCEFDAQGRIIITQKLREYAGITKEVVVIGQGSVAEVWDKATYDEVFNDDEFSSENMRDFVKEKGIQMFH